MFLPAAVTFITTLIYVIALPASLATKGTGFASASNVFTLYRNYSDWQLGVAVPFSFFTSTFVIAGWQIPAFIAEEIEDAQNNAPRCVIFSYLIISALGLLISVVTGFCILHMDAFVADPL